MDVQKWLIKKGFKEESELFKGKRFGNYSRGIIQFYDWLSKRSIRKGYVYTNVGRVALIF